MLACQTRNAKYSAIAVQCLNKLILSEGLPVSRLNDVLEAFIEATHLAIEIQLKILQSLPSLFQAYGGYMSDDLISNLLLVCSILQGSNKVQVVVNTAAATLQQLLVSIFDKVQFEDEKGEDVLKPYSCAIDDNKTVNVGPAAHDAQRIFLDLCLLIEHHQPEFLRFNYISETFGFELIESILSNNTETFLNHVELGFLLRTRVVPILLRAFSISRDFAVVVRVSRIIFLLTKRQFPILTIECEVVLSLLTHALDPSAFPLWKRILCMEIYQGICSDFELVRQLFSLYDIVEGKKKVIEELIEALLKITTEKPKTFGYASNRRLQTPLPTIQPQDDISIGNGRKSSSHNNNNQNLNSQEDLKKIGLSTSHSLLKIPSIDMLDKSDPPTAPDTYLYYMALVCVNSLSDGLANFVMKLSTEKSPVKRKSKSNNNNNSAATNIEKESTTSKSKRFIFLNPSSIDTHPFKEDILICSKFIEVNWQNLLQIDLMFLFSKLENDLFHSLVRSMQKICHASGVLGITISRDGFLLALSKATINDTYEGISSESKSTGSRLLSFGESIVETLAGTGSGSVHANTGVNSSSYSSNHNLDNSNGVITSTHILCLRALLSLALSLGYTLGSSWKIVLITLSWMDYHIQVTKSTTTNGSTTNNNNSNNTTISTKGSVFSDSSILSNSTINLIQSLSEKVFQSTNDFQANPFSELLNAIIDLSVEVLSSTDIKINKTSKKNNVNEPLKLCRLNTNFYLYKLGEVFKANSQRFLKDNNKDNENKISWYLIVEYFVQVCGSRQLSPETRIASSKILNTSIDSIAAEASNSNSDFLQSRVLTSLELLIIELINLNTGKITSDDDSITITIITTESEIHLMTIANLQSLLNRYGSNFGDSWNIAFNIINSPFKFISGDRYDSLSNEQKRLLDEKLTFLIKSSFETIQLVCDDFLQNLPSNVIKILIDTIHLFCKQELDLNISFSAISYFWNISDFIRDEINSSSSSSSVSNEWREEKNEPMTTFEQCLNSVLSYQNKYDLFESLWVYLLYKLVNIVDDDRIQVRNGTIQTFFRIFDAHGSKLTINNWKSCYKIVINLLLLKKPQFNENKSNNKQLILNHWPESISLIVSGLTRLFTSFLIQFEYSKLDLFVVWGDLLNYYKEILTFGWNDCGTTVYKSFGEITTKFNTLSSSITIPRKIIQLLLDFFVTQRVNYKIVNNNMLTKSYLESLTALVESFPLLYSITNEDQMTLSLITGIIHLFDTCIRYPVLPDGYNDVNFRSSLQDAVLKSVDLIKVDDSKICSLILREVSAVITTPFEIIEANKLDNPKTKEVLKTNSLHYATNISVSFEALKILMKKLHVIKDYKPLILDGTMVEVFSSLSIPIHWKFDSPSVSNKSAEERDELWIESMKILLVLCEKVLPVFKEDEFNTNDITNDQKLGIWIYINKAISDTVYVPRVSSSKHLLPRYEQFDLETYSKLKKIILPYLVEPYLKRNINSFLMIITKTSFFYELTDPLLTNEILDEQDVNKVDELNKKLYNDNINLKRMVGSTELLNLNKRSEISWQCIGDLIGFLEQDDNERLASQTLSFLKLRLTLLLRKYISDKHLSGNIPLPKPIMSELILLFKGILQLLRNKKDEKRQGIIQLLDDIKVLLIKCISISSGDKLVLHLLEELFLEMNK